MYTSERTTSDYMQSFAGFLLFIKLLPFLALSEKAVLFTASRSFHSHVFCPPAYFHQIECRVWFDFFSFSIYISHTVLGTVLKSPRQRSSKFVALMLCVKTHTHSVFWQSASGLQDGATTAALLWVPWSVHSVFSPVHPEVVFFPFPLVWNFRNRHSSQFVTLKR